MGTQVYNPGDTPFVLSDGSVIGGGEWRVIDDDPKLDRGVSSGRLVVVGAPEDPVATPVPEDTPVEDPVGEETAPPTDTLYEASVDEPKE